MGTKLTTILVVDDDRTIRRLVRAFLEDAGYTEGFVRTRPRRADRSGRERETPNPGEIVRVVDTWGNQG
jgi:CheY-like chemotaxis protein